jgi:uncharacterized cofD-like protein
MRILCIGGGTGLHAELSGLKQLFPEHELSAVVTMMDSGSNSGTLRDEFGYLPPGDIRQCLVALSDAPRELRELMQYRFAQDKSHLDGYVIGNVLLTALKDINGDEYEAIAAMERILNIKGHVYPVTLHNSHVVVELEDGTVIEGEGNLYGEAQGGKRIKRIGLNPTPKVFPRTRDAIRDADIIIIGPGGIHHSILPNLLVEGVIDAISHAQSHGAKVILVTNTMTKHGDTDGFLTSDFLAIITQAGVRLDGVIVNTGEFPIEQLAAYAEERAIPVRNDLSDIPGGPKVFPADLVTTESFLKHGKPSFARHDPLKLASVIRQAVIALQADNTA